MTIVERLFSSSLLALVSQTSPRRLRVCHFKKGTEICQYSYSNTILAVKLNRARLVVCLEESLYIHNIRDMKVLHTIRETPPNPRGLCALSINSDNCFLAYPGSTTTGEVQLFDAFNLQAKLMIPAHDSPLAAIAFNPTGTKLATASERGTVIRIFSVQDGTRLMEFRRGVKRCAHVYSLAFSQDSDFLALSSNTETIHIFKLDQAEAAVVENQPKLQQTPPAQVSWSFENKIYNPDIVCQDDASWMGYLSKAVTASASYLPAQVSLLSVSVSCTDCDLPQVTDTLNQSRAWATVTVPSVGLPNIVTIATLTRQTRLMLASADGYFYIYNIPGNIIYTIFHSQYTIYHIPLYHLNVRGRRRLCDGEAAPSGPGVFRGQLRPAAQPDSTRQSRRDPRHPGGTLTLPGRVSATNCSEPRNLKLNPTCFDIKSNFEL